MIRLFIIADDFTGALDTGVQFSGRGITTRVAVDTDGSSFCADQAEDVLVIDVETRHLPPQQAADIVYRLVRRAAELHIPYIFKKTDSALRGNVGAELCAALRASGRDQLAFLPAFPQCGRTTVNGRHLIDGVPVNESVFGSDPFEPVRCADVAQLIGLQSDCAVHGSPALDASAPIPQAPGIMVFDSATEAELVGTVRRLMDAGRLSVMAGCAGLGVVLAGLMETSAGKTQQLPRLDPRFLVICGSVNPITVRQMDVAEACGFYQVRLTAEQKLAEGYWETPAGVAALEQLRGAVRKHARCIINVNDRDNNRATEEYARTRRLDLDTVRQRVAASLGGIVGGLFAEPAMGTLLVTGGDTLLQCMERMGVNELRPVCEMGPGVVLSRFSYQGRTRHVLSKSGGLGGEEIIVGLAQAIADTARAG